jgi:hypothetical protein
MLAIVIATAIEALVQLIDLCNVSKLTQHKPKGRK